MCYYLLLRGFSMNDGYEHQFDVLLDAMDEGGFVVDTQGTILRWNGGMERLTGYSAADVMGTPCATLQCTVCDKKGCPFDIDGLASFDCMPQNGVEVCLKQRGGEIVPVLKNTRTLKDPRGNIVGAIVCLTDVTAISELRSEIDELKALKGEVLTLRSLVEGVPGASAIPTTTADLPPAFQLSSQRYQKAEGRRKELLDMLIECRWNKSEVARRMGITRVSVWRRMKQLGLPLEAPESDRARVVAPVEKTAASRADASKPSAPKTAPRPVRRRPQSIDLSWD